MPNPFSTKKARILALTLMGALVLVGLIYAWLRPPAFCTYVPADAVGYVEIPSARAVMDLVHNSQFLERAVGSERAPKIRRWLDQSVKQFNLTAPLRNSLQVGVILDSVSVEPDQTLHLHGVLVARFRSFWIRRLHQSPQSLANKFSDANSFTSSESLRGVDVVVLTRRSPQEKVFIAVHRDAVLLSNQREALQDVLATMDGANPSINKSSSWQNLPPHFPSDSLASGFFSGTAAFNLVRDFLVQNFSPFDDVARTSRFLASLGLDQIQSVGYSARVESSHIVERWDYRVGSSPSFQRSFLNVFLSQKSNGSSTIPLAAIPRNATTVRYLSLADSSSLWKTFADGLGILTNQENPQNRDLMISMFEGSLGFRIDRDLLSNLSDPIALLDVESHVIVGATSAGGGIPLTRNGWMLIAKSKNPTAMQKVLSKVVAGEHPPVEHTVGSAKIYFSDLAQGKPPSLNGLWSSIPAFAAQGDIFYFCPDKDVLIDSLRTLQTPGPTPTVSFPAMIDTHAPFVSFTPEFEQGPPQGGQVQSKALGGTVPVLSYSQLRKVPQGMEYDRISSCGFICDVIGQAVEGTP